MANTFSAGQEITFSTTGTLPTGIVAGTGYFILATGLSSSSFEISTTVGGSPVNTSGTQSGTQTVNTITLVDLISFTSQFSEYEIAFEDMTSNTANVALALQVHSGGAFQPSGYFSSTLAGGGTSTTSGASTSEVLLTVGGSISNPLVSMANVRINNPSTSNFHPFASVYNSSQCTDNCTGTAGGYWETSAAIDGFQVFMSSGALQNGKMKVYARF